MSIIKSDLKPSSNVLSSYFPVRTNIKEGDFDWGVAKAIVVRNLYRKDLNSKLKKAQTDPAQKERVAIESFLNFCKEDFLEKIDDETLWEYIEEMYFSEGAIYQIAPEALLFKLAPLSVSSSQHNLANMFSSLMRGFGLKHTTTEVNNFLEAQIVESLRSENVLEEFDAGSKIMSKGINEETYLPFLTESFNKDLEFLARRPKYLLEQLENILRLYGYLYTAQLALNIKSLYQDPSPKPLFFIMENETASRERPDLVRQGHQSVQKFLPFIFPYLSMSESLQDIDKESNQHRLPLWKLVKKLEPSDGEKLKNYAEAFARDRFEGEQFQFVYDEEQDGAEYWLECLLNESVKQFDKKKTRAAAQEKFIRNTENELCASFVKLRGQIGKVLVMNQDYISLITNLAVGEGDRLRFHELIEEFKLRGIYFDRQSQKALVHFYERMGNVERMSDSGDAVYVRKTV